MLMISSLPNHMHTDHVNSLKTSITNTLMINQNTEIHLSEEGIKKIIYKKLKLIPDVPRPPPSSSSKPVKFSENACQKRHLIINHLLVLLVNNRYRQNWSSELHIHEEKKIIKNLKNSIPHNDVVSAWPHVEAPHVSQYAQASHPWLVL